MEFNEKIHTAIIRFFSGEADSDDKRLLGIWLRQSPENRKFYEELQDIWLVAGAINNRDHYQMEREILNFKERIREKRIGHQRLPAILSVLKYAGILLLLAAIPLSYYFGKKSHEQITTWSTVTCQLGDKSTIFLPDSSKVWLNSGSKLIFSNNFKGGKRELYLEGEAYFSVTRDPQNPFIVRSGSLLVEVSGTEFNLKAYPDEDVISTTLIEGSVKVSSPKTQIRLTPNQKLVYHSMSNKMDLHELTDTAPETEWKEGRLVFRNESLKELKLKLERWFDVDIVLADKAVGDRRYTGILERESILEVMSYFSLAKTVDYKIDGNRVTFYTSNKP